MDLFSDEIRERERKRRNKGPVWTIASFVLHLALFVVIILLTPVKSLIFEPKEPTKNAAEDLSSDRIEEIGEQLSDVRMNELLQQILAMQAVLHNMDMMKQELAKGYDTFAEESAKGDLRAELEGFINETERNQKQAVEAQKAVRDDITAIVNHEKGDYLSDDGHKALIAKKDKLQYETVEKTNTSQGNAINALDKLQVRAEFGGYRKVAEAAAKFMEAQAEASRMQDKVQTDVADICEGLQKVYWNEKWGIPNPQRDLDGNKKWKDGLLKQEADLKQKISEGEKEIAKCDEELAALRKELEELGK